MGKSGQWHTNPIEWDNPAAEVHGLTVVLLVLWRSSGSLWPRTPRRTYLEASTCATHAFASCLALLQYPSCAMPVSCDYTWSETANRILVHVALQGAVTRKPEVTVASVFVGVSSSPYLLQLDLNGEIISDSVTVELTSSSVEPCLPKVSPRRLTGSSSATQLLLFSAAQQNTDVLLQKEPGLWRQLVLKTDKVTLQQRRLQSLQEREAAVLRAHQSHQSHFEDLRRCLLTVTPKTCQAPELYRAELSLSALRSGLARSSNKLGMLQHIS